MHIKIGSKSLECQGLYRWNRQNEKRKLTEKPKIPVKRKVREDKKRKNNKKYSIQES